MVKKPSDDVIKKVQALYKKNSLARRLFDSLAERARDATATSVDNLCRLLGVSRYEAVALARAVEETGCADLWLGRRGGKTRLVWIFSCISVGQAATGEITELEEVSDPEPEAEETTFEEPSQSGAQNPVISTLTIADAKRILAQSLGLEPGNIEINIKA